MDRLLDEAQRQNMTPGALERATEIDYNTCARILRQECRRVSLDTACRVALALGMELMLVAR